MIVVHAKIPVRPDKRDDFLGAVGPLVEATRQEEGNISYECFESVETPNLFAMVEEWQSQEALDAHMRAEHFTQVAAGLGRDGRRRAGDRHLRDRRPAARVAGLRRTVWSPDVVSVDHNQEDADD